MSSRDKDREKDREKDRDREREKEKERDAADSRDKGEKEKEREKERERGFNTYTSNGNTYSLDEPMGMDIGMGLDDRQSTSICLTPMICYAILFSDIYDFLP